ncbi:Hypothetical predicted protein [Olea europaea subsp. europaea]|uniref:Ubiquitin-like protease family profile domain-containing protein n=1 Tax=Olea europaea subsp. europaea TaxID=158383 RepID=A0A8S0TLG0_OLEEU|nr:Hypothetical predicted protein [Olea europaea subsp. europaea]
MLVAFQAWIYEIFPSLDGIVVTKISRVHPCIVNWMADEQPSTAKLEGPDCFSNPKLTSSTKSRRRTKRRTERSVEDADTSRKSVPSVLLSMDSNIGQTHSSDDDDDFVAPPPRRQEPFACEKSPVVEGPTAAHHSQEELRSHGAQRDDISCYVDNKMLKAKFEGIKSHMSSLNEGKTNKMDDIVQMQAYIKSDLMDVRTNMQCISESVSIMISSVMDEIIRRSGDRTSERGVGQTKAPGVGDQEHHVASRSNKVQEVENMVLNVDRKEKGKMDPCDDLLFSLEPPSFDLEIEFTPSNVLHSEETQKRVDSIISDGSSTAEPTSKLPVKRVLRPSRVLLSPFVVGQERGKLFKHDDNVVVFEDYKDNVDEDPDYHEPEAKELKVIIDDTLPQQTNSHDCRIFVVLYALYLICGGRCSIPKKFDASKFRMDIVTLLYKHRQVYTKKVNQPMMEEVLVIE